MGRSQLRGEHNNFQFKSPLSLSKLCSTPRVRTAAIFIRAFKGRWHRHFWQFGKQCRLPGFISHTIIARLDFSLYAGCLFGTGSKCDVCECAQHEDLQGARRCPDQNTIKTYCCRAIARDSMGDKWRACLSTSLSGWQNYSGTKFLMPRWLSSTCFILHWQRPKYYMTEDFLIEQK